MSKAVHKITVTVCAPWQGWVKEVLCIKGFERVSCSGEPSVVFSPSASPGSSDCCAAPGSRAGCRFPPAAQVEPPQHSLEQLGMVSASIPSLGSPDLGSGSSISAALPAAAPLGRGAWKLLAAAPGVPAPPHLPGLTGACIPIGKGALQMAAGLEQGSVSLCPGCSPELSVPLLGGRQAICRCMSRQRAASTTALLALRRENCPWINQGTSSLPPGPRRAVQGCRVCFRPSSPAWLTLGSAASCVGALSP